jgi:hypothetical protein
MPPKALHITLCEIVQSRKIYSYDKEALFELRSEEYFHGAGQVLTNTPAFSVVFDQIEVSLDAIIVRSSESAVFNDIRTKLLGSISLPDETRRPPDITHSSIARYLKRIDVESVRAAAANHTIGFAEPITEFKLLKTFVPPLLEYEELASFQLKGELQLPGEKN